MAGDNQDTVFEDSFAEEVWKTTYKDHKDETVDDTMRRVAKYIASAEKLQRDKDIWEERFYDMLSGFKGTVGGRTYSNAGTEWSTTLHNCFVSPRDNYDIDSIPGIMKDVLNQCLTLKSEGGWGQNFSWIRPRGSFIHGIGVESPGAIKYMEIYDKTSDVITSGSGKKSANKKAKGKIRKGAMMSVIDSWHPDVIEFITAKQSPGRLTKFNMSVNCTDEFMNKVTKVLKMEEGPERDEEDKWNLRFPDTTHEKYKEEWDGDLKAWEEKGYPVNIFNTISATWLWNLIMESTYARAEPGVLFLDRANYYNPGYYFEKIVSTNPCLHGDTLVAVADGRNVIPIRDLAEEGKDVPVFCYDDEGRVTVKTMRNPRISGYEKDIYEVLLDDGSTIKTTKNHKFRLLDGTYIEVENLKEGDSLRVMSKFHAKLSSSSKNDYIYMSNIGGTKSEHRIVAEAFYGDIPDNHVVHHIDFNSLNNTPSNLKIMKVDDHDRLHGDMMKGDNNPMRRAHNEWSQNKWKRYKNNMSKSTSGELNGKHSGISNELYRNRIIELSKLLKRRIGITEWDLYCKENNLPDISSKHRLDGFDSFSDIFIWAAREAGLNEEFIHYDPRTQKLWLEMEKQGYTCKVINGRLNVNRICETCGDEFFVKSENREVSFCSQDCTSVYVRKRNKTFELRNKITRGINKTFSERKKKDRELQATVYNDLKFNMKKVPIRKQWENECKKRNIRFRLGKQSPFETYSELKDFAEGLNHRVVSVNYVGKDVVYNGTVDEYHNFFVGGFEGKTRSGKKKFLFINNLQCGEQQLSPGNICCLGSMNLTQFVKGRSFDYDKLRKFVGYMVRFLDNVNSLSLAPLPEYEEAMRLKRRIGIGVLGWGSALYMLKTRFGSEEAGRLRDRVMKTIAQQAYMSSIDLAEEKGMFDYCDPEKHAEGVFISKLGLSDEYMDKLRQVGIRNSSLLSVQPTGNTSVFANVVSGGLEPIFMPEYVRTAIVNHMPDEIEDVCPKWYEGEWHETDLFKFTKEGDEEILRGVYNGTVYKIDKNRGLTKEVECKDYGVRWLQSREDWDPAADYVVDTKTLTVDDHVNDVNGFARWIDSAMSKTINVPYEYPFEDFQNIYLNAYKKGYIKGITTYRDGTMATVLSAKEEKEATDEDEEIIFSDVNVPSQAPAIVSTIKAEGKKWYLTTIMNEPQTRPIAFFVHTNHHEKNVTTEDAVDHLINLAKRKGIPARWIYETITKMEKDNNATKIARAISLNLRHGVLIKNVVFALEQVDNVFVGSFLFQIRKFLMSYIKEGEKVQNGDCPECGAKDSFIFSEGCTKCSQCGYSKCG